MVKRNWARNVEWNPKDVFAPGSTKEIQDIVIQALNRKKNIRVIGTGHSFTPICATDDVMVTLDRYQGLIAVDKDNCQAIVKAGTKLNTLGELLFEQGMAMENLGDIDVQSIAGTISTGTHGTGKKLGTISTQVIALSFINGRGELIHCSEENNQELFKCVQVSLGTFGIITEVTLQCVPRYKLKIQNRKEPISEVLSTYHQRNTENRNFEYYWIPYTDTAWTKTSNIVESDEPDKVSMMNYWSEYVLENYVFKGLCELATVFPSQTELISKITAASISDVSKVHNSHRIYATQRLVRFKEMEYNVPIEAYDDVIKDIMKVVNSKKYNVHFPIENRVVQADDILMSPAYKRDAAYIACHIYYKKDHRPYFKALEEVFRAYGGRPHWGKMNTLTTNEVATLYPAFSIFLQHRSDQDPDGVFVSPYIKTLFGIDKETAPYTTQ